MPQEPTPSEIREGEGGLPWWAWVAVAAWLVYAFLVGPFDWFPPGS